MIENPVKIEGKAYSLFGKSGSTDDFYYFINGVLDRLLKKYPDKYQLLDILQFSSRKKIEYKHLIEENIFLKEAESIFKSFTPGVEKHVSEQPFYIFWNSVMKLKEWQYHLYMMEFMLTNRIYKNDFLKCDVKIALLPHCLRDLTKDCKAVKNGFDYQCKHCSKECFINEASKILKENGVEPYIWMSANLKPMSKKSFKERKSLGVLGIACIPELVRGMRMCRKKNIPVLGLPLNANRCVRWMGEFYPNSINLSMLKSIISK
jgi:uncharacterized protein